MASELMVGNRAPDLTVSFKTLKGNIVILYFYPKDDTPGCTKEACDFRDTFSDLTRMGARVFGISKDSLESHKKFIQKYTLPFTLLSDPQGTLAKRYGVWKEKTFLGKKTFGMERSTFVIDQTGIIRRIWRNVKVERHVEEVKHVVMLLAGKASPNELPSLAPISAGCNT